MKFIEIFFNSSLQNTIEIEKDTASIGRAIYNKVQIDNKGVSLLHAIITQEDKNWYVEDLNSTNGTYLNGVKILDKQKIKVGDTISICKHELKFVSERCHAAQAMDNHQSDDSDRTVMVGNNQSNEITPKTSSCYLLVRGEKRNMNKLLLNKYSYTIGKSKHSDIQVGGWFTPKLIADISRIGDNYYLFPRVNKLIKLNDRELSSQIKLSNDDNITIKKLLLTFVEE